MRLIDVNKLFCECPVKLRKAFDCNVGDVSARVQRVLHVNEAYFPRF